jgi:hypothetical protein
VQVGEGGTIDNCVKGNSKCRALKLGKIVARSPSPPSVHVVWDTDANSPLDQGPDQSKDPSGRF